MRPTFQGSIVALVTPFRDGKVDEAKLRELVEWHVASGTDGIVPCGTTGESPTLSHDEHKRVVEIVIVLDEVDDCFVSLVTVSVTVNVT